MKELRHFSTVSNGPKSTAKIEFSDTKDGTTEVLVTVSMVIHGSIYDGFVDEIEKVLKFKTPKQREKQWSRNRVSYLKP